MDARPPDSRPRRFDVTLRGYDTRQVDDHVAHLEAKVAELNDRLRAAGIRTQALEKKLSAPQDAEEAIGAAYLAAAEAKQRLLEQAQLKADAIIEEANAHVRRIAGTDTAQRIEDAEAEANRIVHEARAEADRLIARTRTDALEAMAAAQREVETLLSRTREGHADLLTQLRDLKEAVDGAVAKAAQRNKVFETPAAWESTVAEA
jgi:cell division septum initiation protein DivIVA